jgi:hypothetical protein
MEAFQKQRKYSRHKAPKGMLVGWKSAGRRMVSRAEVVGMGGLFLHTANPLEAGANLELVLDLETREFRGRAVVRDSSPGRGMDVQFVQMEPTAGARLNQFLARYGAAETEQS